MWRHGIQSNRDFIEKLIWNLTDMTWIEGRFEENVITTTMEDAMNWGQQSSIWPMTFGLACCAIEMMATGARVTAMSVLLASVEINSPVATPQIPIRVKDQS